MKRPYFYPKPISHSSVTFKFFHTVSCGMFFFLVKSQYASILDTFHHVLFLYLSSGDGGWWLFPTFAIFSVAPINTDISICLPGIHMHKHTHTHIWRESKREVELPDHMLGLFLIFWETSIWFSTVFTNLYSHQQLTKVSFLPYYHQHFHHFNKRYSKIWGHMSLWFKMSIDFQPLLFSYWEMTEYFAHFLSVFLLLRCLNSYLFRILTS